MSSFETVCPELDELDLKISLLKKEIGRGFMVPAAYGYALRELEFLEEERRERYRQWVVNTTAEAKKADHLANVASDVTEAEYSLWWRGRCKWAVEWSGTFDYSLPYTN